MKNLTKQDWVVLNTIRKMHFENIIFSNEIYIKSLAGWYYRSFGGGGAGDEGNEVELANNNWQELLLTHGRLATICKQAHSN